MNHALESPAGPVSYDALLAQASALVSGERDFLANAANLCALLFYGLPALNWVGIYRLVDGELVLGPFHGKPACTRIALGSGVCGTAALRRETVVVRDVHEFAGHIACDSASNSEIVIPLIREGRLVGVLDIDSPEKNRFDDRDAKALERFAQLLVQASELGA